MQWSWHSKPTILLRAHPHQPAPNRSLSSASKRKEPCHQCNKYLVRAVFHLIKVIIGLTWELIIPLRAPFIIVLLSRVPAKTVDSGWSRLRIRDHLRCSATRRGRGRTFAARKRWATQFTKPRKCGGTARRKLRPEIQPRKRCTFLYNW